MDIFHENVKTNSIENNNYRRVAFTGKHLQFVYMSIEPLDNIHLETHENTDQFIRVEQGNGIAIINNITYAMCDDFAIIIPAGSKHEIINTSKTEKLKLYSIYAPPEHADGKIDETNPDDVFRQKYIKYKMKYLNEKALKK